MFEDKEDVYLTCARSLLETDDGLDKLMANLSKYLRGRAAAILLYKDTAQDDPKLLKFIGEVVAAARNASRPKHRVFIELYETYNTILASKK